ncbi:hypothetical protein ACWD4V_30960 [Streptomyces tsukubensis]
MPENTVTTPLAPMQPEDVTASFAYIRAMQAGDIDTARRTADADAEPRMPELLADIATRIVLPVTEIRPMHGIDPEPVDDSFALETLGRVFVSSLRSWARSGPDAAEGIARTVIDFITQFFTEDHENVADVLRQVEAAGMRQAMQAHPAHRPTA